MSTQNVIAVIFDCDDTLCLDTITFLLQSYGIDPKLFWREVAEEVSAGWDPPLAYMYKVIDLVSLGSMPDLTNEKLRQIGSQIRFFPGIPGVFKDLTEFVKRKREFVDAQVSLEFYIVTGGFEEMIRGSIIAPYMKDIFGCTFWEAPRTHLIARPRTTVTFTEKTKFVYAVNKGVTGDELRSNPYLVNDSIEERERRIPFHNMIYVGDGPSDIPCFSLIQSQGGTGGERTGHVIGVYKRGAVEKAYELARGDRITAGPFSAKYTRGSDLRKYLEQNILDIAHSIVTNRRRTFRHGISHS